jgi:hypothetical protein
MHYPGFEMAVAWGGSNNLDGGGFGFLVSLLLVDLGRILSWRRVDSHGRKG